MSNTEFGRRGAGPGNISPTPTTGGETQAGSEQPLTLAEVARSPLLMQLGGILCGVLLLLSILAIYVGIMKGAGRALEASWNRKTIGPSEAFERQIQLDPDFAELSRRPCSIPSLNPKFREIQRELGC
jgi:hypothetical protein